MSEGKMNYERQRARAEVRAELSEEYGKPYDVQQKRQIDTYLLYLGSIVIGVFGQRPEHTASGISFRLLEMAQNKAKILTPGPDTEQDNADA